MGSQYEKCNAGESTSAAKLKATSVVKRAVASEAEAMFISIAITFCTLMIVR